ncbi:type II secretion system minor pseudopilin GspJ [Microbulbifer yueqingensis]|uniref:Type II secretion system protein J n=1 Tax=Microbulbifer yueqingensis TaxID=658219 RepID=A0A1G8ZYB2_9GAMM|nr:type II secretion system minor pseudopilin GspJ [Microbulbifer yueqingensis]SDK20063.1 general secretion pathway protein J [Microbulbifer yueqingensis]
MIGSRRPQMALARGFTLIEVMVVLVLVTIISIGSFALLDSFQATDSALAARAERMRSLSMAMYRIDDDFRQVTARPVKNGYTGFEPAMRGDADEIEFTRLGAANLTGDPRGELQRLGYSLGFPEQPEAISGEEAGGLLLRSRWRVLDRAPDSEAVAEPLLDGIENLAFRYYDGDTEAWLDQWPPVGTATTTGAPDSRLPRAVEIRITTLGAGELRRVYALPEAPVAGLSASAGGGTDADSEPDPEPGDTGAEDSERDREAPAEDGGRREDADAS